MYGSNRSKVCTVCLIIAVEIRCVLEIVCIKRAVRKCLVGKYIVVINNYLKVISFFLKNRLNLFKYFCMRC